MSALFKCLTVVVTTAFAGKLICIQHVVFKYNRIINQAAEDYYEPINGFLLYF